MKKLLLLDFDRTLFDSDAFINKLWQIISTKYKLDFTDMLAEMPKFYHAVGELRYYDFALHLQEATGQSVEESIGGIRPEMAKTQYQYSDVEPTLHQLSQEFEIRILSFGQPWFQNLKMSFTHIASDLPRDIILSAKNEFIADHFAGRQGALVDDKRNSELPKGFTEIWLNRDSKESEPDSIITINSLKQLPEVLHEMY